MSDTLLGIVLFIVFIVFIVGPFWLISKMDKRAAKKGALFTGQATGGMKILAIVIGVVFAGIFVMELLSSQTIHLIFPIVGVALIGYGLGAGQLLSKLQKGEENLHPSADPAINQESAIESLDQQDEMKSFSQNRFVRFGKMIVVILVISAIFLYAAVWVSNHPDNPLALVFVIGVILFLVLARILDWFKFLKNLFK